MYSDINPDMDKDDKIRSANRRLDKADEALAALAEPLTAVFAPPAPPRAPMLAVMRVLANEEHYFEHCTSARCRRSGRCCAAASQTRPAPCAAQWDALFALRLEAAFAGVAAAWADETLRLQRLAERASFSTPAIRGEEVKEKRR